MKKILIILSLCALVNFKNNAQNTQKSFSIGVFKWKSWEMANAKLELSRGHWGISGDYTFAYEEYKRTLDASIDQYELMYGNINARWYTSQGNGFFAEAGLGGSFNKLKTVYEDGNIQFKNGFVPTLSLGIGFRYRKSLKGLFFEGSLRNMTALEDKLIYTTSQQPPNSKESRTGYHSLNIEKFERLVHPSINIGYTF